VQPLTHEKENKCSIIKLSVSFSSQKRSFYLCKKIMKIKVKHEGKIGRFFPFFSENLREKNGKNRKTGFFPSLQNTNVYRSVNSTVSHTASYVCLIGVVDLSSQSAAFGSCKFKLLVSRYGFKNLKQNIFDNVFSNKHF